MSAAATGPGPYSPHCGQGRGGGPLRSGVALAPPVTSSQGRRSCRERDLAQSASYTPHFPVGDADCGGRLPTARCPSPRAPDRPSTEGDDDRRLPTAFTHRRCGTQHPRVAQSAGQRAGGWSACAVGARSRRRLSRTAPVHNESRATAVRGGPGFSPTVGLAFRQDHWVEVAGIEPASFDASPGLLRAQPASPLLGPIDHADKSM